MKSSTILLLHSVLQMQKSKLLYVNCYVNQAHAFQRQFEIEEISLACILFCSFINIDQPDIFFTSAQRSAIVRQYSTYGILLYILCFPCRSMTYFYVYSMEKMMIKWEFLDWLVIVHFPMLFPFMMYV